RSIDERPPMALVRYESLVVHDPQERLHGVEGTFVVRVQPLTDLSDAGRSQFPKHLEDIQFTVSRREIFHRVLLQRFSYNRSLSVIVSREETLSRSMTENSR